MVEPPSAQERLLRAIKNNSVRAVRRLLPVVDLEYTYGYPYFGSCLYIAAKEGSVNVAKLLIRHGADVNCYNDEPKNTPLHVASELGHSDMVKLLIDEGGKLKNRDKFGRTPLHLAAFGGKMGKIFWEGNLKTIKELINAGSPKNAKDQWKNTPLSLAVEAGHKDAVRLLIELGANPDYDPKCRSSIKMKMPEVYDKLLRSRSYNDEEAPEEDEVDVLLFDCVHEGNANRLQALLPIAIEKGPDLGQINDGLYTLLQCACMKMDCEECVSTLLGAGVSPNATLDVNKNQPLLLAAHQGNSNSISLLVDCNLTDLSVSDDKAETALHKAAKMEKKEFGEGNYQKCIEILTKVNEKVNDETPEERQLDVNAIDAKGNTALHYAMHNLDGGGRQAGGIVAALLRAGSYIGIRNRMGELAISRAPIPAIEKFMNDCIETSGTSYDEDYKLTFDYKFIVPSSKSSTAYMERIGNEVDRNTLIRETELLSYFCESKDHQRLLKHPIISSFLYLKWHSVQWVYYFYLVRYLALVFVLTPYILVTYLANSKEDASDKMEWKDNFFKFSCILITMLAFSDFINFAISPIMYVTKRENLIVFAMHVFTMVMLFANLEHHVKQHLAGVSILLIWIVLFFVVGQHPRLLTYTIMFRTVFYNFIYILTSYLVLLVAFALSFLILLHKRKPANNEQNHEVEETENSIISDLGYFFFKTAVMLTGELDLDDIPLNEFPSTSHFVFLLFSFLITLVLNNLLISYSISDIQALRDEAELIQYKSKVAFMSILESLTLGRPSGRQWARLCLKFILSNYQKGLSNMLESAEVTVKDGRTQCSPADTYNCFMDPKVIEAARSIIANRNRASIRSRSMDI